MKKIILTIALTSLIILNHCEKNKSLSQTTLPTTSKKPQKVVLSKEKAPISFILNKKIEVLDIVDPKIAVSSYDDRVIVYGRSLRGKKPEFLVRIFNKNLEDIGEKVMKYGQGPGEVGGTNILSLLKEQVIISVNSNNAWNIYDSELNFLKLIRYEKDIFTAFSLEENGSFFIDSTRRKVPNAANLERYTFRVINFPQMKTRRTLYQTKLFSSREKKLNNSIRPRVVLGKNLDHSFFYKEGYLYILLCNTYHLIKVNLDGEISKNIVAEFKQLYLDSQKELEYLKEHQLNSRRFICKKEIPPTSCMIPLGRGFIVTRKKDYHRNCHGEIEGDYFSYDLESIGKVIVPCFYNAGKMKLYWMLHTYKYEGQNLYLVKEEDEIVFVEKWRVME